jgi:hypothetical protein
VDKQRDSRGNRSIADSFCVNVGMFMQECKTFCLKCDLSKSQTWHLFLNAFSLRF